MFLIRTAFWLGILILLLPTSEQEQKEVYGTAKATVSDLKSFCTRNPGVCETTRNAAHTFSQKAEFGARMVMDFLKDPGNGDTAYVSASEQGSRMPSVFRRDTQSTLTQDDLQPAWTVPSDHAGI